MITISIDVLLLDKARFKRITRKDGKEAVFCDLVLFETPDGKYGDYVVKQSLTKEERLAKKEMPILGNGKNWGKPTGGASITGETKESDDVPF